MAISDAIKKAIVELIDRICDVGGPGRGKRKLVDIGWTCSLSWWTAFPDYYEVRLFLFISSSNSVLISTAGDTRTDLTHATQAAFNAGTLSAVSVNGSPVATLGQARQL
jgi:hypothetical protein